MKLLKSKDEVNCYSSQLLPVLALAGRLISFFSWTFGKIYQVLESQMLFMIHMLKDTS